MANYVFEEITQSDANNFTSADNLFFNSATVPTLNVQDNPSTSNAFGTVSETVTLTSGSQSLTFLASAVASASEQNHIVFIHGDNNDALAIVSGDQSAAGYVQLGTVTGGGHVEIYGLDSSDTLAGTAGDDTISGGVGVDYIYNDGSHGSVASENSTTGTQNDNDYLQGGAGGDSITGGDGNEHIYGNLFTSTAGAADGADTIHAGAGNDYVNGNGGDDQIFGEGDNDKLYGGAGNDTIDGGIGNDYLQGNKGNDSLVGGTGNDVLHGGADNDILQGGAGNDLLYGDNGNDTVTGGAGYDSLYGGAGNDTFTFAASDASNANVATAATAVDHGLVDTIQDFTDGSDTIALGFVPTSVLHTATGVTFTDASAAQTYAQQLIDNSTGTHATTVAAITVGSDTYLFYDDLHTTGTIDAAIHVVGVADSVFNIGTGSDFVS